MRRLVLGDLRQSWRVWVGALVVLVVVQLLSSWVGALLLLGATNLDLGAASGALGAAASASTQADLDPTVVTLGLVSAVATTGLLLALVMVATVGAVATLVVTQRRRLVALWQLSGMTDGQVRRLVSRQLLVVGLVATVVGGLGGLASIDAVVGYVADNGLVAAGTSRAALVPGLAVGLLGGLGVVALGARRAGRTIAAVQPLEVLRTTGVQELVMTRRRTVAAVLLGALGAAVLLSSGSSRPADAGTAVLLGLLLLTLALSQAGPWLLAGLVRRWTALVPPRVSVAWHLARHALGAATGRVVATVVPVVMTVVLVVGTFSVERTTALSLGTPEQSSMFGVVVVVGLPMVVTVTGSVVMVLMAGQQREKEIALGALAGATPRQQALQALFEAVVVVATGAVLGLAGVLLGLAAVQPALTAAGGTPTLAVSWGPFAVVVLGLLVANVVAAVVPTLLSMTSRATRLVAAA